MKIIFEMKESIYNCQLQVNDSQGSRSFLLQATEDHPEIQVELCSDAELILLPTTPDIEPLLDDMKETTWKDRLAKKAVDKIGSFLYNLFLRVGCRFQCKSLQNGDRLTITLQTYTFGTFDWFGLLDLLPMIYMFFEIDRAGTRLIPENAWATNRKEVVRHAKSFSVLNLFGWGLFSLLFHYPIQMGRIKHLSKDKTVNKKVMKFSMLPEQERQAFLKKQERFFNN